MTARRQRGGASLLRVATPIDRRAFGDNHND